MKVNCSINKINNWDKRVESFNSQDMAIDFIVYPLSVNLLTYIRALNNLLYEEKNFKFYLTCKVKIYNILKIFVSKDQANNSV